MKKKIILAVIAFFVAGFISFGVMLGIRMNNDMKKYNTYKNAMAEFQKIVENINTKNIDELKKMAEDIKSEGDYARVEKAAKEYIRDTLVPFYDSMKTREDSIFTEGISNDFLTNNMPDFKNAYSTLDKMSEQLNKLQTITDKLFTREAAMEYLGEDIDEEYKELYENEVKDIYEDTELFQSYTQYIQTNRTASTYYHDILDFLVANANKWYLKDGSIIFKTTALTNQFNALAEQLNSLSQK